MKRLGIFTVFFLVAGLSLCIVSSASARDLKYQDSEVDIFVKPGEPTQIKFPGNVSGGFKRKNSGLSLDRNDESIIVFPSERISEEGEGIIVRLKDGRTFSLRIRRSTEEDPRDDIVNITDNRGSILASGDEEAPAYAREKFSKASPNSVSGLLREMILAAEFSKNSVPGYRVTEQYKGETVLNDGTILATIDRIFIGSNLWGYVINATNLLDQTQKINPATFRLDGTRAVSAERWELSPKPITIEQQIAEKHRGKIYIITKARNQGS